MRGSRQLLGLASAVAVGLVGCSWSQYGAGPWRTSWNPVDSGISVANAPTVAPLWQAPLNHPSGEPAIARNTVYATTSSFLNAYPASGAGCSGSPRVCAPRWTASLGWVSGAVSSPVVDSNRVFVAFAAAPQWGLRAYDADGGGDCSGPPGCPPLWSATWGMAPASTNSLLPVAVAGGRVYVLTESATPGQPAQIAVFDEAGTVGCGGTPVTCEPLFQTVAALAPGMWPTVADGHIYAPGADFGSVLAFDAAGVDQCSAGVCAAQLSFPAGRASVSVWGNTLFAGGGPQLQAFDATGTTGCSGTVPRICSPKWTGALGGLIASSDPPTVAGGRVFVGASNASFKVFDAAGVTGCSGTPRVCQPLWSAFTSGNFGAHISAARSVLVVSSRLVIPPPPTGIMSAALDIYDLAGQTGCAGVPVICGPLRHLDLGSRATVSSPSLANGKIAVIESGFSDPSGNRIELFTPTRAPA